VDIREAVDCSVINRLSVWDTLTIVAAESAHCEILCTEDLNHGQIIRGVRIENPLRKEALKLLESIVPDVPPLEEDKLHSRKR
jgi:hypothetical protein